jgi:tight adherence protein B
MVNLPTSTWLPALLVFLAVALGTVAIVLFLEWAQERRRQRDVLQQLRAFTSGHTEGRTAGGLLRAAAPAAPEWMQPLMARTPAFKDLDLMVAQAGMTMTASRFVLLTVGLASAFGLSALMVSRFWVAAVVAAFVGALLPYMYVRRRRTKRINTFEEMLPEAIDLLGRAIRAGHPLSAGMKMVADETRDPIASEFRRTHDENRFGLPFEDAILAMADRVNLVDVRILVTAILIQREVGGNLAEVLDNLSTVIRARFTIRRQLRVYTAQGRFSGYVLSLLPIATGFAIYSLNPSYMMLLFTDPMGKLMVATAILFQIIGFLWIRKIVDIEI